MPLSPPTLLGGPGPDPQRADNAAFHHYDEAQSRLAYLLFFVPRHARALAQALAAVGDPPVARRSVAAPVAPAVPPPPTATKSSSDP